MAGPPGPAQRRPSAPGLGYAFVHSAVDAHSRLANSEVLTDEQGHSASAFWRPAQAFFAAVGIDVERVLTDNGSCYRSREFAAALGGVVHSRTPSPPTGDQWQGL